MNLHARDLTVRLGGASPRTVLERVDLELGEGEVAVLAGRSGEGKSTLAAALFGLLRPPFDATGEVHVHGRLLWRSGDVPCRELLGRSIALVPADGRASMHPAHRALRLVAEPLVVRAGMGRSAARRRASALLEEVGLPVAAHGALPHELSGGMCQRVALARALALDPRVVVADEPTSALDEASRDALFEMLAERTRRSGGSLLLITHHLDEVAGRVDRRVRLDGGTLHPVPPATVAARRDVRRNGVACGGGDPVLVASGLDVGFTARRSRTQAHDVLDGVDLTVRRGEVVAIVGRSGAGKSTLLRTLVGLQPLRAGRVVLLGSELGALSPRELRALRARARMVPQDPGASFDPRWSVRRAVREPLDLHGRGTAHGRDEQVAEVLAQVGLDPALGARPARELSSGQRQRAALARALVSRPDLLLADEPTASLDAASESQVLDLLARLRDDGLGIVVTSHHRRVVEHLADRVVELCDGRLRPTREHP